MVRITTFLGILLLLVAFVEAHDFSGHSAITYQISPAVDSLDSANAVELNIVDDHSGQPLAARFAIEINSKTYVPPNLSREGIRFTSIHTSKKQRETILYSRGDGPVRFVVPENSGPIRFFVTRGYEFLPVTIESAKRDIQVRLRRWIDLSEEGWYAADTHLHYERIGPEPDVDWATMLEADGLSQGFFMVLKGGNVPGVWAEQFAYGKAGMGVKRRRLLVPGEEFRGTAQGHNNLFGMDEVIMPISVGGMGKSSHRSNWPAMVDVLKQSAESGGIGGPAHGGTFGKASTVYLDAILGASEFMELANSHLYELEPWYHLLSCGVILPPVAGTDLPNFPFREKWQPFFGETCTFVRMDDPTSFESWKKGLRAGECFVTTGPVIKMTVNRSGDEVSVEAELASPVNLTKLEIICNGRPVVTETESRKGDQGVHRIRAEWSTRLTDSCWVAARGEGVPKRVLWSKSGVLKPAIAHTAAFPCLIKDQPIVVPDSVEFIRRKLSEQKRWYRENGTFPDEKSRNKMSDFFDRAMSMLPPAD